jgi:hypothetical protein
MRVLFDQGTPKPLRQFLPGHQIRTAYEERWNELSNGDLLRAAERAGFEVLISTDQNLEYQQNLSTRVIAIIILPTTRWPEIRAHVIEIADAVNVASPGSYKFLTW